MLRACPQVIAFGSSQSNYRSVVRERDQFAFFLCFLADQTRGLKEGFADLCHQTWASCFVMQRCI